jgi:hypothetical protein
VPRVHRRGLGDDDHGAPLTASLLFVPPYSPAFNPIEKAFANLKALLRKAAARTVDGLSPSIGRLLDIFTPIECANDFSACGYDPDRKDSALGHKLIKGIPLGGVW